MAPPNRKEAQRRKAKMLDTRKYLDEHGSDWKPTSINVPDGMEVFRFETPSSDKPVLYMIDTVPYVVARHKGEPGGNPFVEEEDVGSMSYERTYYVHNNVGAEEKRYVCPHKEWKTDCPICEYVQELLTDPKVDRKKVVNPLRPKERQLFLFYDRTTKESRKKGLQLYECAHYMSFGELLKNTLEAYRLADPESPALSFADPDDGMSLAVTVQKTAFSSEGGKSGNYGKPTTIQFVPRDRALPAEILEAAPCLDDIPAEITYDKLYKLFHQSEAKKSEPEAMEPRKAAIFRTKPKGEEDEDDGYEDDEDQDEAPAAKAKRPVDRNGKKMKTAEDLGIEKGDDVEYEGEVFAVVHISGDGTSLRLKGEDGNLIVGVSVEEVSKVTSAPKKGGKKAPPVKAQAKPVDDDEDEEEEDEGQDDAEDEEKDDDEDDTDEDEDDDEKPAAKKGPGKGGKGGTPPSRRR